MIFIVHLYNSAYIFSAVPSFYRTGFLVWSSATVWATEISHKAYPEHFWEYPILLRRIDGQRHYHFGNIINWVIPA